VSRIGSAEKGRGGHRAAILSEKVGIVNSNQRNGTKRREARSMKREAGLLNH
jgi:hypothetical protein